MHHPHRQLSILILLACGTATLLSLPALRDARLAWRLRSAASEDRRRAAWSATEARSRPAMNVIRAQLKANLEPDADVREAFVYALGRAGQSSDVDVILERLQHDASVTVRAAALPALARVAPAALARAAATCSTEHATVQVAWAAAWLELGDLRGLPLLFMQCRTGGPPDAEQATRALSRYLAPLLDAVGRWPLVTPPSLPSHWPAEFVDDIEQRCSACDLADFAADTVSQVARSAHLRQNVARLASARQYVARLLFPPDRAPGPAK